MKTENITEEVTHDTENLRKKNETEAQNTVGGHSTAQNKQKAESELKDQIEIKGKLRNCYPKTQDL
jgi:hypothetical protein